MKVMTIKGSSQSTIENVKIFKPVQKIFLRCTVTDNSKGWADFKEEKLELRVRLVDGRNGNSTEIVPQLNAVLLADIASKTEGFHRKFGYKIVGNNRVLSGSCLYSVVLNDTAAVDLSNDKYLDIEVHGMQAGFNYEIWGMESHILSNFCRTYKKFYLSGGELDKSFGVDENELLVLPLKLIREVQFYTKNGLTSPVFRSEELMLEEDTRNDIVGLGINEFNRLSVVAHNGQAVNSLLYDVNGEFGFGDYGIIDITPFNRFDLRRDQGTEALMFIMIDSVETAVSSPVVAAAVSEVPKTANAASVVDPPKETK